MSSSAKKTYLGDYVDFQNGYAFKSSDYTDKGHYLIRIKNVQQGFIEINDECFVNIPSDAKFEKFKLKNGDIVVSLTGNVGRIARIKDVHLPAVLNQRVASVAPKSVEVLSPEFLYYLLRTPEFLEFAIGSGKGAAQQNISTSDMEKYQVSIPSLEKQIEIVKKLDTALSEIELLEGNLEIGEERSNELLNSLLNESFTYTSTEEGSHIALSNHEIGARMVQLKDVVSFDKKQGSFVLAYVGLEDIESNTGSHLGSREPRKVKSNSFAFTSEHLLYGRLRPYLNKVLLPDFDGHCSTEIFPIKVTEVISREYLFYWFRLPSTVEAIDETSTGARMPRANMDAVLEFKIPLPPIEKQKEIVQKLDKALAEIDLLKAQIRIVKDYVDTLRQSLLGSAFKQKEAVG